MSKKVTGYKAEDIAPMFADVPDNVVLPDEFLDHIRERNV